MLAGVNQPEQKAPAMTRTQQIANDLRPKVASIFRLGMMPKVVALCFRCSPTTAHNACQMLVADGLLTFDGVSFNAKG